MTNKTAKRITITDISWKLHIKKINRWLKRLEKFCEERSHKGEFEDQLDFLEVFFIHCYHLKDYLKNSCYFDKDTVESFVKSNKELRICRDICNQTKHLVCDNPSIDPDIKKYKIFVPYSLKSERPHEMYDWQIWLYDKDREETLKLNGLQLARKCIELWGKFTTGNNLIEAERLKNK